MRIALAAPTYLPARRANTIQVMKMAQALVAIGHQVRVTVPDPFPGPPRQAEDPEWLELAHHYGLQHRFIVEWLPALPRMRRYDYAMRAVQRAQRWGAHIFYTRLPQAALLACFNSLDTILEMHDIPGGILGPWIFRRFVRSARARRLVAISHTLADDLAARYALPAPDGFTLVAPDGVDLERYADLPAPEVARKSLFVPDRPSLAKSIGPGTQLPLRLGQPPAFIAGYTGHLYPGRGSELLLGLAARLPEITFLLAGGEPQDISRLGAQVNAQGLQNVILVGFVANADLPLYQAACDVLLMPYQQHVAASSGGDIARYLSPMKLFEYLACGRAILSSDLPVLREVLSPEIAVLLPPEDVTAWVASLLQLYRSPQERARLAQRARQAAGQYRWEARAERLLAGLAISLEG
jgi:glycosyltransferase involved in cell wall biosynthesis